MTTIRELLRRLAAVEPLEVPPGEPGVVARGAGGATRTCVPVLSVYLDLRPQVTGERPAERPGRVILRERLHQIEQTLLPRGMALDTVRADAARIERYLDERVGRATHGVALFASAPHGLFEAYETDAPFADDVVARATPDLFQLARHLDDQETAVAAVVHVNAVRLFVVHRGGLRELRGQADDPKLYHMVRGANAMDQAHFQRHAVVVRERFAREVAGRIGRLVDSTRSSEVVLAGDPEAVGLVRRALTARIAALTHEPAHELEMWATREAVLEDVAPLLAAAEAARGRDVVERLVEAVQADGLGVVGAEPTTEALRAGRADVLVLAGDVPLPPEVRSELVALAARTDATIETVEEDERLSRLGGVGALLRYRLAAAGGSGADRDGRADRDVVRAP